MTDKDHLNRPILRLNSFKNKTEEQKSNTTITRALAQKKLLSNEAYHEILSYMQQHYPKCFPSNSAPLPLSVDIHNKLLAMPNLPFSRSKIRKFLIQYTSSAAYQKQLIVGHSRFDLDGTVNSKILLDEVSKKAKKKRAKHDNLIKKALEDPITAQEMLSEYLSPEYKELIDLNTLKIEKESFIEDNLNSKFSDIVYSAKIKITNHGQPDTAFVYTLIEHSSSSDHWLAFRILKYSLLLLEKHTKDRNKLPVFIPLVLYNGKTKYSAPRNIWQLFAYPELAQKAINENYKLIDLHAMSDDDINYEKHLSFLLFSMKHIHDRDLLAMLQEAMARCRKAILIDKSKNYIHIRLILWYLDSKVPEEKKRQLEQLIIDNLPEEDRENIMRTVADSYRDEGIKKGIEIGKTAGILEGIEKGIEKGVEKGRTEVIEKIAQRMLLEKADIKFISSVTGLSKDKILKLKSKI